MEKLSTYIVNGVAIGNWSVSVDATSPEDATAQVEAMIDEFDDAPAAVIHDHVDVGFAQRVGPAIARSTDPIHPNDVDRDASRSTVLLHRARSTSAATTDDGDSPCKI